MKPSRRKALERFVRYSLFAAYVKTSEAEELLKSVEKEEEKDDFQKIRCPLCSWQPTKSSRWCCGNVGEPEYFYDGCFTMWNTFDTGGKCPGCAHQWRWTSCLRCKKWSRHEDWYEKKTA
ncbi:MAG TPA: hypothetical protein PKY59_05975 [Pyrinomonadaceae bacterium]|nr:hypothetical protein [Pyrinomonadaceae bacterium]